MIEVEKKFALTNEGIDRITSGAVALGEKTFMDVYYDDPEYTLTKGDKWLRQREGKFELKLPRNQGKSASERKMDRYEEIENEEEIQEALGLDGKNLVKALEEKGIAPFCEITTTRRKYKAKDFTIDLDVMDFGYSLGEVEVMVSDESQMDDALNKILTFLEERQIELTPTRGKVIEYLRLKNLKHYEALKKAGVI